MESPARETRETARRLVIRASKRPDVTDAASRAQAACEDTCRELSRWLGPTGAHALLTRALIEAQGGHAALADIRAGEPGEPIITGVTDAVAEHGDAAVAAGLEAVLVTSLELLGRLIGDDLVLRLLDADGPDVTTDAKETT